jgi:hypothetical protein
MRDNVRSELQAQRAMADLPLDDATLDRLAEGIAANLDYAFSIAWSPRWVKGDEPHRWTEGSQHFVECLKCKRITVHPTSVDADRWYEDHSQNGHG